MTTHKKILAKMGEAARTLLAKGPFAATSAIQSTLGISHNPLSATVSDAASAKEAFQMMHDINPSLPMHKAIDLKGFSPENLIKSFENGKFMPHRPVHKTAPDIKSGAQFLDGAYTNLAGTRRYKLYVPSGCHGQPLPLVVMLHGCTQNAEDFATGTRMNAVAEEKQCLVVYPIQEQSANSTKCWNWFQALDQQRDKGEPSIIAGITRQIMQDYAVDPRQVFIAGLSAGGAMATIMGTTYPDLYAGVGVHSGLPYAAAHDLPSAFAAMKGQSKAGVARSKANASHLKGIPIIVFHGDKDTTVHPRNGEQVLQQHLPESHSRPTHVAQETMHQGQVPDGHAYTRTMHHDPEGIPIAEHWLIHDLGHAWAGGSEEGSYTDPKGPDAAQEMMRFFYTNAERRHKPDA